MRAKSVIFNIKQKLLGNSSPYSFCLNAFETTSVLYGLHGKNSLGPIGGKQVGPQLSGLNTFHKSITIYKSGTSPVLLPCFVRGPGQSVSLNARPRFLGLEWYDLQTIYMSSVRYAGCLECGLHLSFSVDLGGG